MKQKTLLSSRSMSLVLIILAFVVFYAAYFLVYVPQQEALVEKRAFRILKGYAENMHNKLGYYKVHLDNYSSYYLVRPTDALILDKAEKIAAQQHREDEQIKQLISNLDKTIITELGKSNDETVRIENEDGGVYLKFDGFKTDTTYLKIGSHQVAHLVPITTFMENLKFDQLFVNIALICDTATLYNSSLEVIQGITNPGLLSENLRQTQGGLITKMNIRGDDNHVIILPISFLDKQLYLAGFIPAPVFRQKTRDINSEFLIILAGILLLLLFSMPILKIVFMSRLEQLHARDATAAAISLFLGVGVLILIIVSIMNYYVVDRQLHSKRIEAVSDTLYQNFMNDVESIKTIYAGIINDSTQHSADDFQKQDSLIILAKSIFRNSTNYYEKIPNSHLKYQLPLNEVFLIGDDGIMKSAISRTGVSDIVPINLSSRAYYKNMLEKSKEGWTYELEKGVRQRYFIESLKSYNSGEGEAAFSFRVPDEKKFSANILAITSPLPSMFSQVLPEDVRCLVIDDQGNVLFHSNQSKNLHENFLRESSANARLQGAIKHRIDDAIYLHYNEKYWRARIKPIKDAPLYHVTLIDIRYTQDKNARVLVFTFYFVIATFIMILVGMMIVKIARIRVKNQKNKWFLSWLLFSERKRNHYLIALIVQIILLTFHFSGMLFDVQPLIMFSYQVVLISFSVYFAILLFNVNDNHNEYLFVRVILFCTILLLTALFVYLHQRFLMLMPLIVVVLMTMLSRTFWSNLVQQTSGHKLSTKVAALNTKSIFRLYVFLWMISISCVPALQYYSAVKKQEDKLWKRNQMEHIALKNLELKKEFDSDQIKSDWFDRINGSGIDFIEVAWKDSINAEKYTGQLDQANSLYASLPDPVTKGNQLVGLLYRSNLLNEWSYHFNENDKKDSEQFTYSRAGFDGYVGISRNGKYEFSSIFLWLYFTILAFLVLIFLWVTFRYVINIVLRSGNFDYKPAPQEKWEETIWNEKIKRILLISLREKPYQIFDTKDANRQSEPNHPKIRICTIDTLPEINENDKKQNTKSIIWLSGFGEVIKDPKALENALPKLNTFIQNTNDRIIIHLPFGFDYVKEYHQSLIAGNKTTQATTEEMNTLKNQLESTLKDFYLFNGIIVFDQKESANIGKLQYMNIWQNLSNVEKLTLNDLSEDGMLNYKNTSTINQLLAKGLIKIDPNPRLFSESLNDFISNSVDPEETIRIRAPFAKKGSWHNKRYLILLVLIPMILFIFIVQGTPAEKVLAISTGGLAVLSGVVRLFDSDIFRRASSA